MERTLVFGNAIRPSPLASMTLKSVIMIDCDAFDTFVALLYHSRLTVKTILTEYIELEENDVALLGEAVEAAAPHLTHLTLAGYSASVPMTESILQFDSMIPLMKNLVHLEIGLRMVNPSTVFNSLAKLPLLGTFILIVDEASPVTLRALQPRHLLRVLGSTSHLKRIFLPRELESAWFGEDGGSAQGGSDLMDAAERAGVHLTFLG